MKHLILEADNLQTEKRLPTLSETENKTVTQQTSPPTSASTEIRPIEPTEQIANEVHAEAKAAVLSLNKVKQLAVAANDGKSLVEAIRNASSR